MRRQRAVKKASTPSSKVTDVPSGPSNCVVQPQAFDHCTYTFCPAVPAKVHLGRSPATGTLIVTAAPPTVIDADGSLIPEAVTWNEPVSPFTGTSTTHKPRRRAVGQVPGLRVVDLPAILVEVISRPPGPKRGSCTDQAPGNQGCQRLR